MNNYVPRYLLQNLSKANLDLAPNNFFELLGELKCACGTDAFLLFDTKEILTSEMKAVQTSYNKVINELISKAPDGCNSYSIRNDTGKHIIGYNAPLNKFIPFRDITELEIQLKNFPLVPTIITAVCADCKKEILIFDCSKHGYDAFTSELEYSSSYKMKKKSSCRKCKSETYKVSLKIQHSGKEDAISDGAPEINEENWQDAFDWITIDLECAGCGKINKSWLDFETS